MNIKKLQKIFNHYKKKYKLDTRLEVEPKGLLCNYRPDIDYIYIGYEAIGKGTLSKRLNVKSKKYLYILALLHEIKHAIDKNILIDELKSFDLAQYHESGQYHDTRTWEVRADNFAKKEFKKWKGGIT